MASWDKVGAVPPTRSFLKYPKVRREFNYVANGKDPVQSVLKDMQQANDMSTDMLILSGYQGHLMKA